MKIAFLFAGQGAQKAGMGLDFYLSEPLSRTIYDSISMDFDLKEVCFTDENAVLNQTQFTQACILATSIAIAKAVEASGYHPYCVGGLSLGEYSALCFAKSISLQDALNLVRKRGILMANALPSGTSSMTALIAIDQETIHTVIKDPEVSSLGVVEIANYNSPKQVVISGEIQALRKVEEKLKALSIGRIIPLNVSGAFHSSLLNEASKTLGKLLTEFTFKEPEIPVYYNVSGMKEPFSTDLLTRQIASSVHFQSMIESMISDGVDTFIEMGPGKTLSSFVKQIEPNVAVFTVESMEGLNALKGACPL